MKTIKSSCELWQGPILCGKCGCKFTFATAIRYPSCPNCKRTSGLIEEAIKND